MWVEAGSSGFNQVEIATNVKVLCIICGHVYPGFDLHKSGQALNPGWTWIKLGHGLDKPQDSSVQKVLEAI